MKGWNDRLTQIHRTLMLQVLLWIVLELLLMLQVLLWISLEILANINLSLDKG